MFIGFAVDALTNIIDRLSNCSEIPYSEPCIKLVEITLKQYFIPLELKGKHSFLKEGKRAKSYH